MCSSFGFVYLLLCSAKFVRIRVVLGLYSVRVCHKNGRRAFPARRRELPAIALVRMRRLLIIRTLITPPLLRPRACTGSTARTKPVFEELASKMCRYLFCPRGVVRRQVLLQRRFCPERCRRRSAASRGGRLFAAGVRRGAGQRRPQQPGGGDGVRQGRRPLVHEGNWSRLRTPSPEQPTAASRAPPSFS